MSPMNPLLRTGIVIAALMFAAAALAVVMRPSHKIADRGPRIDLEAIIPKQFADWRIDPTITPVAVSPDVQEKLDEIYDQTLSRTYVNDKGQRIMLSISYGGDQSSDKTQVHRPEYCYAAQGFQLSDIFENALPTSHGDLPVRRLKATQGSRLEPITYWITLGDNITLPGLGRKLLQLRYGLTGKVPDGMLIRISSIDPNTAKAYRMQDQFAQQMLAAMSPEARKRLTGNL